MNYIVGFSSVLLASSLCASSLSTTVDEFSSNANLQNTLKVYEKVMLKMTKEIKENRLAISSLIDDNKKLTDRLSALENKPVVSETKDINSSLSESTLEKFNTYLKN